MKHYVLISFGELASHVVMDLLDQFPVFSTTPQLTYLHLDAEEKVIEDLRSRSVMIPSCHLTQFLDLRLFRTKAQDPQSLTTFLAQANPRDSLPEDPRLLEVLLDQIWAQDLEHRLGNLLRPGLLAQDGVVVFLADWTTSWEVLASSLWERIQGWCDATFENSLMRSLRLTLGTNPTPGANPIAGASDLAALLMADALEPSMVPLRVVEAQWKDLCSSVAQPPATGLLHLLNQGNLVVLSRFLSQLPWAEALVFLETHVLGGSGPTAAGDLDARRRWLVDHWLAQGDDELAVLERLDEVTSDDRSFCEELCLSGQTAVALAWFGRPEDPTMASTLIRGFCREHRAAQARSDLALVELEVPSEGSATRVVVPQRLRPWVPVRLLGRLTFSPLLERQFLVLRTEAPGTP